MTSSEINAKISYHVSQSNKYATEKKQLQDEVAELEALKSKFVKLQAKFQSKQSSRRSAMRKLSSRGISMRVISNYTSGMNSLLNGNEYDNADSGLTSAKIKIQKQIDEKNDKITSLNSSISYEDGQAAYWRGQLQYADDATK